MNCYVELEFHDTSRGNEAVVLWRSRLPDRFATADAAVANGRTVVERMGKPAGVVGYRLVDDAGHRLDESGEIIGDGDAA